MQTQKLKTAADEYDARLRNLGNSNGSVVSGRRPVRKSPDPKLRKSLTTATTMLLTQIN